MSDDEDEEDPDDRYPRKLTFGDVYSIRYLLVANICRIVMGPTHCAR